MRTSNFPAFGGRVIFKTRHLSMIAADWIDRALESPPDSLPLQTYRNLVYALGLTVDIEFNFQGDENPMLEELRDFWQAYQATPEPERVALAVQWRRESSGVIMDAWVDAANAGTLPFRDPVKLPGSALNAAEQEEARDPNSPLVKSGAKSESSAAPVPGESSKR